MSPTYKTSLVISSLGQKSAITHPEKELLKARRMGSIVQYAVGSVHAVTEDGRLIDAEACGSQHALYAYTADCVVLVVGTQKIVKNLDEAFKRT